MWMSSTRSACHFTCPCPDTGSVCLSVQAIRNAEKAGVVVSSDILKYHIVPGPPAPVTALNDDQIFVTDQGGTIQAGLGQQLQ